MRCLRELATMGSIQVVKRSLAVSGFLLAVWLSAGTVKLAAQDQPQDGELASQVQNQSQGQVPNGEQGQATEQNQGLAQDQTSASNVARLSFVQGGVQVNSGGQVDFEQAVANMPILEGSHVQTAQDGEAEVEFSDGSVARLTPNSSLEIDHLGADSISIQQLSGLAYYELNTGQGLPSYQVTFNGGGSVTPTSNAIFRVDLDNAPEIASMTGTESVLSNGQQVGQLNDGQTFTFQPSDNSPYTVSQNIASNSWDQWNQDRDQAISQEASAQTPERDDSGDSGSENWNDLDTYGDWYSVPGSGNVWVPAGVGAGWDPFGFGYWGFYPGLGGYVWISGYPWGWLPYHCGAWNSYSFGWGWTPGGCGGPWLPVSRVYGYAGYRRPMPPAWRRGYGRPIVSARLVVEDRGAAARGPWGMGHRTPVINHQRSLNFNGRTITPVGRVSVAGRASVRSSFTARGTSPGMRSTMQSDVRNQQRGSLRGDSGRSTYTPGAREQGMRAPTPGAREQGMRAPAQNPIRPAPQYRPQERQQRPVDQGRSRTTYTPRSMPNPHYSAPPAYHPPSGGNHGGGGHSGGGRHR